MFFKKWKTRLVLSLTMILVVTTIGSLGVFARSSADTTPTETVNTIEVKLLDDAFFPKVITIQSGTSTTVILKNEGKKEHTFTVEKLGIDAEVQAGKEKKITLKPLKPGTYDLICRYHFQEGMVGKVIVK